MTEAEGLLASDLCLQEALDQSRLSLEVASRTAAARDWLKPCVESSTGTKELYTRLEDHVSKNHFLDQLKAARASPHPATDQEGHGDEVLQASWWQVAPSSDTPASVGNGAPEELEALDSYVMVEQEDVLEAIGAFVAAYLVTLPEAQNLQPAELQKAIAEAFKQLRKGNARRLWEWGKAIYRCAAVSYSVFSMYENPWLVRAILAALWTSSRVMLGLLL